jgi:esterase/lipase
LLDLTTLEATLAASEAGVPHLRAGCHKRIVWAGKSATKTGRSVVFIHGFSATGEEIRPLPDLVADHFEANLFITRLNGHGQDADAMGRATLAQWQADVSEALAVAQTIGDEVIVIGCSTGCTLATLAFSQGARAAAMIHVSPNFGLSHRAAQLLLDLPGSRSWSKFLVGDRRSFPAQNDAHAAYWTLEYPTEAVHVMAETVRATRKAELENITTPALFCFNAADQVVDAARTRRVIGRWGARADKIMLTQTDADDTMGHIMAGDIFSPQQTRPLGLQIIAWLEALPRA